MFKKILIANRGEIATRIIRAAKEMGISTVAVCSEIDKDSLHCRLAEQSICIGPAPVEESYLNMANIITAAEISGADAIHPGYGFLAENTRFAEASESSGIKFIGPSPLAIKKMGDKIEARKLAQKYGVPVIPGSDGPVDPDDPNLPKLCKKIGYPIIVKAAGGGGGKGMRIVTSEENLKNAIITAQQEAKIAFGNPAVYIEKFIEEPKHIEFQVIGDNYNNVASFPERDCTIQRRHQKLLEESPSPAVDEKLRKKMGKCARLVCRSVNYNSVGTVEFLLDKKGNFYFLEMNTRIQVEHPVTEMVTGVDIIKEQIRIAAGEKLGYKYDDIQIKGHAIECRINAEDPEKDFIPSPGKITNLVLPGAPGVRVDTHIFSGYTIPSFYDSLIAKLIVIDEDRQRSIIRMKRALSEFIVEGIKTTIPFHIKILNNQTFQKGRFDTNFLQKEIFV